MYDFNYSLSSKILHQIALGNKSVMELSFDWETAFQKNKFANTENAVIVTGLARSGTTILMRALYETERFTCLTYNDMPFVLMPGIWSKMKVQKNKTVEEKERAHADGIMVSINSPEAFEEIFWKCFCGNDYIRKSFLVPHEPNNEVLQKFQLFIKHVLLNSNTTNTAKRYLSKNNNQLLRLPTLMANMPQATFVIPFRLPVAHAFSLLKQHKHFTQMQKQNAFVLKYMNWLGHYEFGMGHKPFIWDDDQYNTLQQYSIEDINYWLVCWKNYYEQVLSLVGNNAVPICYEDLSFRNAEQFQHLLKRIDIPIKHSTLIFKNANFPVKEKIDDSLLKACMFVYEALRDKAMQACK
jgi:hypothetical protein